MKIQLTKNGYDILSKELIELKEKKNLLITRIEENSVADEDGENLLTVQLKEELELVDKKIDDLEEGLLNSEIISGTKKYSLVEVGCKVKVKLQGKEKEFHIVSHFESDPTQSKISDQSPLGQALVGKKVGEEVVFNAPLGVVKYKIVAIG